MFDFMVMFPIGIYECLSNVKGVFKVKIRLSLFQIRKRDLWLLVVLKCWYCTRTCSMCTFHMHRVNISTITVILCSDHMNEVIFQSGGGGDGSVVRAANWETSVQGHFNQQRHSRVATLNLSNSTHSVLWRYWLIVPIYHHQSNVFNITTQRFIYESDLGLLGNLTS